MATRAHSTRTPLLRPAGVAPPLLPRGFGRQPGPVTIALAAMHAADPDQQHIRELRRRISERIEADIALLDHLDGDTEREDAGDAEPSLCGLSVAWPGPGGDDREDDPAEWGIADSDGLQEQNNRDRLVAL